MIAFPQRRVFFFNPQTVPYWAADLMSLWTCLPPLPTPDDMNGPSSEGPVDEEGTSTPRTLKDHGSISTDGNEGVPAAEGRDRDEGGDEKHKNDDVVYEGARGYPQTGVTIPTASRAEGNSSEFDPPVFRKGDLVRLSNE
jgi:hypothetical protein